MIWIPFLFVAVFFNKTAAQKNVIDFILPDSLCINKDVIITNLSQGATTYLWNFCSANVSQPPLGLNLDTPPGTLNIPVYLSLVSDGNEFYSFITNSGDGTITRIRHGQYLSGPPNQMDNLGNLGFFTTDIYGIVVLQENSNWYGIVTNGSKVYLLTFGNSLMNFPTITLIGTSPLLNKATGLTIERDGVNWTGFSTNIPSNRVTRIYWGNSLLNTPQFFDMGDFGGLSDPRQLVIVRENLNWYMFISHIDAITQVDFGNSLMNTPTYQNLGNIGSLTDNRGIAIFFDCEHPQGLVVNHNIVLDPLVNMRFLTDLDGIKTGIPLGNIGALYLPFALSEITRNNDTIITFAVNSNSSLTALYFADCHDASISGSALRDPPPYHYLKEGFYTVTLTVDYGLPTEEKICKQIFIEKPESIDLGPDVSLCSTASVTLDAGSAYKSYLWNTGDTSRRLTVNLDGTYWVDGFNQNSDLCRASDTVEVSLNQAIFNTRRPSICDGEKYYAQHAWQDKTGTYFDTLTSSLNCDSIIITELTVKGTFNVSISGSDHLCPDDDGILKATIPGASSYQWQDGSSDSILVIATPGLYYVTVEKDSCMKSDSLLVKPCIYRIYFPNAFTPNGDGINDFFRPNAVELVNYKMKIFDRWGRQLFETSKIAEGWDGKFSGKLCAEDVYTYSADYRESSENNEIRIKGTFMLIY